MNKNDSLEDKISFRIIKSIYVFFLFFLTVIFILFSIPSADSLDYKKTTVQCFPIKTNGINFTRESIALLSLNIDKFDNFDNFEEKGLYKDDARIAVHYCDSSPESVKAYNSLGAINYDIEPVYYRDWGPFLSDFPSELPIFALLLLFIAILKETALYIFFGKKINRNVFKINY